ncbi:MAG: hypothetical protein CMJ26_07620 [Phycisphaerae bacterium]|jgi:hypothetical protein|nr:hypothetical protein [Phycisphaerae bacterium]|tara:strand:- start:3430 stop:4065 length:636 start_codon:yes stop_codon:yes gene_type:complete
MEALNTMTVIEFGDKVTHPKFPEWGSGAVVKVENTPVNGEVTKRITVRFAHAGLKKFVGDAIPLDVMMDGHAMPGDKEGKRPAIAEVEDLERSGLTQAVEQKLEEIMFNIPLACRDPFNTLDHRLRRTLALYKYDLSGKGLMEWSMAQTGMDDPLTRFNRTELEDYFKQYSFLLKQHLAKLVRELQGDKATLKQLLDEAPEGARRAVSKLS